MGNLAFNRPTLSELITRTQQDFESRLGLMGKVVRNTFVWVFARVYAGLAHGVYGFIAWVADQIFPDTADEENLVRWATLYGLTRTPAAFAEGELTVNGTEGETVPVDSILVRADGVEFKVLAEITITSGVAVLPIRAVLAGEDGNTEEGVSMSFQTPVENIDLSGLVTEQLVGGADQESVDALRARLLARMSDPIEGGAASDYEAWALSVAGVTRAWVKPLYLGEGTVGIFFVRDNDDDIFPSEAEVEEVSGYIEERRPVTAHHYVFAPTADFVDFTLSISPDTQAIREAVTGELDDMFFRDGEPGGTILLSHMNEAISLAQGENDHTLTTPSADYSASNGYLPMLGTVTFI